MSFNLLSDRRPKAKKEIFCNASEYIENCGILHEKILSFSEYRDFAKAKKNEFMVQVGERYVYQASTCDGDFCVFKAIESLHEICLKHDLYAE